MSSRCSTRRAACRRRVCGQRATGENLVQFSHSSEIIVITLLAAIVNGALGYGFSSITVPLALLFLTNRVLNPGAGPDRGGLNAYVLWVNRAGLPRVWRAVLPIAIGLVPGVIVGTLIVAQVRPDWLKFWTFALLLPLILVQAAGLSPSDPRRARVRLSVRHWRRRCCIRSRRSRGRRSPCS